MDYELVFSNMAYGTLQRIEDNEGRATIWVDFAGEDYFPEANLLDEKEPYAGFYYYIAIEQAGVWAWYTVVKHERGKEFIVDPIDRRILRAGADIHHKFTAGAKVSHVLTEEIVNTWQQSSAMVEAASGRLVRGMQNDMAAVKSTAQGHISDNKDAIIALTRQVAGEVLGVSGAYSGSAGLLHAWPNDASSNEHWGAYALFTADGISGGYFTKGCEFQQQYTTALSSGGGQNTPTGYDEVWLERTGDCHIRTGITGSFGHVIHVRCCVRSDRMAATFGFGDQKDGRLYTNIFGGSGRLQYFCGDFTDFYDASVMSVVITQPFEYEMKMGGLRVRQDEASDWEVLLEGQDVAVKDGKSPYLILDYPFNTEIATGLFREAKISNTQGDLLHHLVPVRERGSGKLYIFDKVTGAREQITQQDGLVWWNGDISYFSS